MVAAEETDLLVPESEWSTVVLHLRVKIAQHVREVTTRFRYVDEDIRDDESRHEASLAGKLSQLEGALRAAADQVRASSQALLNDQSNRFRKRCKQLDPDNARDVAEERRLRAVDEGDEAMVSYWQGVRDAWDVMLGKVLPSAIGMKGLPAKETRDG